jgi:hypothetical protein
MTVYVDTARNAYGRMKMCHMIADSLAELHELAEKIGMKLEWFQGDSSFPHYDVSLMRRGKAIAFGAIELERRGMAIKIRELKKTEEYLKYGKAEPLLRPEETAGTEGRDVC